MMLNISEKVGVASWPGIYRVFGLELPKMIFELFDKDQKDARRKVMQIRGGITSRSALFDLFMPI